MSMGIIEALVEDLVELQEEGSSEDITLAHIGSVAIAIFNNHIIGEGGLKSWMLNPDTNGHLEILIDLTDYALENGVEDIRPVNELFHRIDSIEIVFDPEVKKITEEYADLDNEKLIKAYSDSVLLHFNFEDFLES